MKTVVVHSGGLDSTVLLYWCLEEAEAVLSLSFYYGQLHSKELQAAVEICRLQGVAQRTVQLGDLQSVLSGSALTSPNVEVPEGHYEDESMRATVVPNRNMIMIAIATGYAISSDFDSVAFAAHAGDHSIYPDCRRDFVWCLSETMKLCHYEPIRLEAPFLKSSKADIVKIGAGLQVPFELTWSCYKGGAKHCGKCGTCVERKEAFELAGVEDPTEYEES